MTTHSFTIDRVLTDKRLLGAELGDGESWQTWRIALKGAFGLELTDTEREVFGAISGGRNPPAQRVRELWCIIGRRGGKSRMAAALACYFALFVKHKLSGGERGMVLVLAATVEQAKVVFDYVVAFLNNSPVLQKEISSTTRSEIRLKNGINIAIHANSFRSVRGRTLCACIFDEVSYWRDDTTATPDAEVYSAVLPALITTNGMLIGISSPYRRLGLMYTKHKRFFGADSDDTLVVHGPTLTFNKTLDPRAIAAQQQADPEAARSEWDAEFRADIATFLDDELIEAAVDRSRPLELPRASGVTYKAFVDASGGAAGGDAYSLCIAHKRNGRFIVDCVRGERGPFDPVAVTEKYIAICRHYGVYSVTGDKYGREWVRAAWQRDARPRMNYYDADLTASELYLEMLPLFTRGLIELPDHPTLLRELRLLERMPTRSGKDQVTHPRGVNDDFANAVAGALRLLSRYGGYDINNFLDDDQRQDQMTSEPCPIPEGMTVEQYESITRPPGGPHRELLEADPQLAAKHQRYIDTRLAELKAKYPEHDRRFPSSPRKAAA